MSLHTVSSAYRDPSIVDRLSDRQLEEFAPALTIKWSKYIPHQPTAKQWAVLLLDEYEEILYGGAAGGGKSDLLLMSGLQYADTPGYAGLLLRRKYADLEKPGALIPRSHEWLDPTDAHWDGMNRQWKFPSGAVLDFGYLDGDADLDSYQGGAWQFIGFDELTQFKLAWYQYLFSRKRRLMTQQHVPTRVRGASNPGGVGHEWVYQRFLVEGPRFHRMFVPARLEDNNYLDQDEYANSLKKLDETKYQQLRWGSWTVRPPGEFFDSSWFKIVDEAPSGMRKIRSWDLAATKNQSSAWTAGVLMGLHNGQIYILDIRRRRGDPGETEDLIQQTAAIDGKSVSIHMEQEGGSAGVNTIFRYQRTVLLGYAFYPFTPRGDKVTRARPLSAAAKFGNVFLVRGTSGDWINTFLNEAAGFPEGFKDQIDAASQGFSILTMEPRPRITRL